MLRRKFYEKQITKWRSVQDLMMSYQDCPARRTIIARMKVVQGMQGIKGGK
jgi:hypothetical protein